MPWYCYLAYKHLFPSGRRLSFFAAVSILGVMLGVMVLVVVQSVMNGFQNQIREKLIDTNGHIRIESDGLIHTYDTLLNKALKHPRVQRAAPYAQGIVMMQHDKRPAFPYIRGIDKYTTPPVVPIEKYLILGEYENLTDEGILVGSGLASSLGIGVGSYVDIYTPLMMEKLKDDELLLPRSLEVVGIFETGWGEVDGNTLICTLTLMQELYGLGESVRGIEIALDDAKHADAVADDFNKTLPPPLRAYTWLDTNGDLLFVLRLEKSMMFFIMIFIVLVASFSMASTLMTSVIRKTREFGLLHALGGRRYQLGAVYCFQGLFIGLTGTGLGIAAAAVLLHYRNEIVQTFATLTHSQAALARFYQFANLPAAYEWGDFAVIIPFTVIISTLAGLLPAFYIARVKPAEALRYE